MKDYSKANRGRSLEDLIKLANMAYMRDGKAIITKIPTEFIPIRNYKGKVVDVKVEHKSTVDFIGEACGFPVAFESKNTNTERISFSAIQPHQYDFLESWDKSSKNLAFVVVSFNRLRDFYVVPWGYWKLSYDLWKDKNTKGQKGIYRYSCIHEVSTTGKASMKPSDLPDAWKVEAGSRYILNYLKTLFEITYDPLRETDTEMYIPKYIKNTENVLK